jgi:glycosyltransferase involved in cell wall biosynthesis
VPTIGVALCTYNGQRYVGNQIKSILAQTRKPDLILACDDASQDDTVAQLRDCASDTAVPFRIICNSENLGYLRNFEQAIGKCDADIIVLSDQDDCWSPDKLRKLEASFQEDSKAAAVFSDAEIVDEDLQSFGYGLLDVLRVSQAERAAARRGDIFPVLLRRNIVAGATLAFRASWKSRVLPLPDGVVHDEWIALVIAAYGAVRFLPERLIRYRQHGGNEIGARRWNVAQHLGSLGKSRRAENGRVLALMRELRKRLAGTESGNGRNVATAIDEKIAHLERRVSLPAHRLLRVPAVAAEFATGRYSRYSSGWRTVVRDLVSPM